METHLMFSTSEQQSNIKWHSWVYSYVDLTELRNFFCVNIHLHYQVHVNSETTHQLKSSCTSQSRWLLLAVAHQQK